MAPIREAAPRPPGETYGDTLWTPSAAVIGDYPRRLADRALGATCYAQLYLSQVRARFRPWDRPFLILVQQ